MTLRAAAWAPLAALHPHDLYQARAMGVPLDGPMAGGAGAEALRYSMGRAYAGQLVETDAMMGRVLRALAASEAAHTTCAARPRSSPPPLSPHPRPRPRGCISLMLAGTFSSRATTARRVSSTATSRR